MYMPAAIVKLFPEIPENKISNSRLTTQINSLFIKGPRLYNELTSETIEANKPLSISTLNSFKNSIKTHLIEIQSCGCNTDWVDENFRLCIQKATRKSPRENPTESGLNIYNSL